MPNRLADESSPYLLQHADNPVEWFPWGSDALDRAQSEDKPILLSVGYSACHWCHVMAHESFENPETARVMNEHFVNVKVDREERPDIDAIYMQAVQAMTGQGGWPMTVFLTPAGEPFYGGTYFPPDDRHGLPSFQRVLLSVSDAWTRRRDDVVKAVRSVADVYAASAGAGARGRGNALTAETLERAGRTLASQLEPVAGGFGGAPKFPHAMALDFALRRYGRTGDREALRIAAHSFARMAAGGIHDHVGGGFHRYSVDAAWQVPHFEKMLYDNALLARLGIHLWQATRDPGPRRTAEDTLRWVMREMTDESGGWYSSLDADSEHEEGKFYVWELAELERLLGADAPAAIVHFGATAEGNFEGRNILHTDGGVPLAAAPIERSKRVLLDARAHRVRPGRDEKVLASWNGLMLRAMAEGARVFGDAAMGAAALANGEFLAREMMRDGRVLRAWTRGTARLGGYLEDHAAVALGFVGLYQLTFDRRWLDRALALATTCVGQFWSDEVGAFFDTAHDHEALVARPREVTDNAVPAGTSLAVELLLVLSELTDDAAMRRRAETVLGPLSESMGRYPTMFGHLLGAADLAVNGAVALAIVGDAHRDDFRALARVAAERYVPALVLAGGPTAETAGIALLAGRTERGGRATAHLCRGFRCDAPTTDPAELASQLAVAARTAPQ